MNGILKQTNYRRHIIKSTYHKRSGVIELTNPKGLSIIKSTNHKRSGVLKLINPRGFIPGIDKHETIPGIDKHETIQGT